MRALELKIPPAILVLLVAAAMWLVAAAMPLFAFSFSGRLALCFALIATGGAVAISGVARFRSAKTTVNPLTPDAASSLVIAGIYRFTRNPMYLGLLLALGGWALFVANFAALAMLPVFVLYMNRFQIKAEEIALSALFSNDYARYKSRVRRWL